MTRNSHSARADELLANAAWIRALARSLIRDSATAEDIAQDAWIAVLRRPPPPGKPVRPWLARTIRNLIGQRLRSETSRKQREAVVARREALPSSGELVERTELQRVLVGEVLALDEPYRSTVLLHHFEGLSLAEVAGRQGLATSTVRSQLTRARQRLRERLAARDGYDERRLAALLIPLTSAEAQASGALSATTTSVGLAMKLTKISIAATTILLLAFVGDALLDQRPEQWEDTDVVVPVASAEPDARAELALASSVTARTPMPVPAESSAAADEPTAEERAQVERVHGRVVDERGVPVVDAEVWTGQWGVGKSPAARTDPTGAFSFPRERDSFDLGARHPDYGPSLQLDVRRDTTFEHGIELVLSDGVARGTVRVLDPDGAPVAGARIEIGDASRNTLLPSGQSGRTPPPWSIESDADGLARFDGVSPGRVAMQVVAPGLAPWSGTWTMASGAATEVEIVLLEGCTVEGRVVDASGQPLEGVHVWVDERYRVRAKVATKTAADGCYELRGVPSGPVTIRAGSRGFGQDSAELALRTRDGVQLDFVLEAEASVRGKLVGGDGSPLVNWLVGAIRPGEPGLWLVQSRTAVDGGFELFNPPAHDFDLEVRTPQLWDKGPIRIVEDVEAGQRDLVIEIPDDRLPVAYLLGRVVYPDGEACGTARIRYHPLDTRTTWEDPASADGAFRIGPLRPGRNDVSVSDVEVGDEGVRKIEVGQEDVELGEIRIDRPGALEILLPIDFDETESVRFHIGRRVKGQRHILQSIESPPPERIALRPGDYLLTAYNRDFEVDEFPFSVQSLQTTVVEPPLRSRKGFSLRIVAPSADGPDRVDVTIRGYHDQVLQAEFGLERDERGEFFRTFDLDPGIYRLHVSSPDGWKAECTLSWAGAVDAKAVEVALNPPEESNE